MLLSRALISLAVANTVSVLAVQLPELKLPYGTWRASKYDSVADVYTFRNIRYAAPPTGPLRFASPAPPAPVSEVQDGSYGPLCPQMDDDGTMNSDSDEDCLFLDVYVPGSALETQGKNLSVLMYIFGGSYTSGGKDSAPSIGLYDGTGFVYQSHGEAIVVVPNYRLGALGGWWGGSTAVNAGATSLGLADQRAALEWIRDYIHILGGNPLDVTVMGQSAGGGSILHHITQFGGERDPLFHKAIIQSPGWQDEWNHQRSEAVFQYFSNLSGCPGGDFGCLRTAPVSAILSAQAQWAGTGLGPTPDGKWIRDHPALELQNGHYWSDLESVVVTHVVDEGGLFVPPVDITDSSITATLTAIYEDPEVVAAIEQFYPPVNSSGSPYQTGTERQAAIASDSLFLAKYRYIAEAFAGKTFAASRTRGNAGHGDDVPPTWYNPTLTSDGIPLPDVIGDAEASQAWQSYLVSFILTGNVNPLRNSSSTIHWGRFCTASHERLRTLDIGDEGFRTIQDTQGTRSQANFWREILGKLASQHPMNW
ncbi:Alpha/Beta hydrolase protein [Stachybotrys elegans]|uniref:Alpha/Beta hydrolase protein n=1 Tax=Stachybotrys elegans TaxID=80388 RepID=A0A8K0SKM9_9HYPO|nr:Alpha/Beta hydrolase protein [Stachybotrys elegans]